MLAIFLFAQMAAAPAANPAVSPDVRLRAAEQFATGRERDGAVPLDWAGPAARLPGADPHADGFNPTAALLGETTMCVVTPGEPAPPCAGPTPIIERANIDSEIFAGGIGGNGENPDQTCQTVETVRRNASGQPQRVFASVCGEAAEAWQYRTRNTPRSSTAPTQATDRAIGPNEVVFPNSAGNSGQ